MEIRVLRNLISVLLAAVIITVAFCVLSQSVYATDEEYTAGSTMTEEDEDEIALLASGAWSKNSNGTYNNGNGSVLKGAIAKGIDVSKHQKDINWSKVKDSGIDYVILRCGYRDSKGVLHTDEKWTRNVAACEKYGIPYGVYFYSTAKSTADVNGEISKVKSLLKGHSPVYPVYYDLEDPYRLKKKGKTFISDAGLKFCKDIKAAGYKSGIYASKAWWDSYLNSSSFNSYEKWVAQWNKTGTTYKKSYSMWQCTSSYSVSGISGRVDLNFAYKDFYQTPGKWDGDTFLTYVQLEDGTYDVEADMVMVRSSFIRYNGQKYYLDENGQKAKGFKTINGKRYYFTSSGIMRHGGWFTVSSKKYYATSSGPIYQNSYKKLSYYYYVFDGNGAMVQGKSYDLNGKRYYTMSNGKAYLNKSKAKYRTKYKKGAGKKYKSKGKLKKGKNVYVIRVYGKWSQLSNGYWVPTKALKKVTSYPVKAPAKAVKETTKPTTQSTTQPTTEQTTEPTTAPTTVPTTETVTETSTGQ